LSSFFPEKLASVASFSSSPVSGLLLFANCRSFLDLSALDDLGNDSSTFFMSGIQSAGPAMCSSSTRASTCLGKVSHVHGILAHTKLSIARYRYLVEREEVLPTLLSKRATVESQTDAKIEQATGLRNSYKSSAVPITDHFQRAHNKSATIH
jgi:hypothetical protein